MTVCKRCGLPVYKEKVWSLRKTYPYYCPQCDENMFSFEVMDGEPQQDYYLVRATDLDYPVAFPSFERDEMAYFIEQCEDAKVQFVKGTKVTSRNIRRGRR